MLDREDGRGEPTPATRLLRGPSGCCPKCRLLSRFSGLQSGRMQLLRVQPDRYRLRLRLRLHHEPLPKPLTLRGVR